MDEYNASRHVVVCCLQQGMLVQGSNCESDFIELGLSMLQGQLVFLRLMGREMPEGVVQSACKRFCFQTPFESRLHPAD